MAHEFDAFEARNVRILGISVDSPQASREFAASYEIPFPLIEDEDQEIIKQYVGVDESGFSLPGTVIIGPDRTVALRQIGETREDRIYAPRLLEIVDGLARKYGIASAATTGVRGGYAPPERFHVRVGAAMGLSQARGSGDGLGFSAGGAVAGLVPMNRHLMLGAMARGLFVSSTRLDLDLVLRVRTPILYDVGELYVQIPFGASFDMGHEDTDAHQGTGWNGGLALGLQFALKPSMVVYLELEGMYHHFTAQGPPEDLSELRYTAGGGVGFLF